MLFGPFCMQSIVIVTKSTNVHKQIILLMGYLSVVEMRLSPSTKTA